MVSACSKKVVCFFTIFTLLASPLAFFIAESRLGRLESSNEKKSAIITSSDNPPKVDLSELPEIDYDEIIEPWYDSKIEMLIITPDNQAFVNAVTPLMEWKNQKGVKTAIVSDYSGFPGADKAEKIRNLIKYYYENENLQWVLLAGDAEEALIPIREVYNPDVLQLNPPQDEYNLGWGNYYKPTDFYYADLTGSWDDNENGIWGESSVYTGSHDEIDWTPEVYVGRFPADNAIELEQMVNKSLKYETNPYIGNWMNRMLLAGGISTNSPPEDEARLTQYIWQHYTILESNFNHLFRCTGSFTPDTPTLPNNQSGLTEALFISEFNSGYSTVIFAGHGTPYMYNDANYQFYHSADAAGSSNNYMPSLVYGDACSTNAYDKTDDNIGETLIKRPYSGAIGYIGGLRVTLYFEEDTNLEMLNRGNAKLFWEEFFKEKEFQQGKALYDSKIAYMESDYFTEGYGSMDYEWERKNVLTYCLLGDPELDVYTDEPTAAQNPIVSDLYEAQLVSWRIYDSYGDYVPNARVNLKTADGKYRTEYADKYGNVRFRLAPTAGEKFNVTITGHNLLPSSFYFTSLPDDNKPWLKSLSWEPENPTVSENMRFNVIARDLSSGIERVFVLISDDEFESYDYEEMDIDENLNGEEYTCSVNKLKPGIYSVLIVARDYANNIKIFYEKDFEIKVPMPPMNYVLNVIILLVVGLTATSVIVALKGRVKYLRTLERVSEKEPLIAHN